MDDGTNYTKNVLFIFTLQTNAYTLLDISLTVHRELTIY